MSLREHIAASTSVREPVDTTGGIHVTHLSKIFGSNLVVDDVSFGVERGQFCTLLGPSGSGKSTILRMLAGLDRPDGGDVMVAGRQFSGPRVFVPPEKREIGFVFQAYALWPHMRVFDQVAYPLRLRHRPRQEVRQAVEAVFTSLGLEDLGDRYPSELSGGQQQRVALARALVLQPAVLLLDEPLSNLDTALRHQMRQELEEIHQKVDVTTVYVTHDQEEAMALSDVVVLLDRGRVVEVGSPREVYENPRNRYTARFIGSSLVLDGICKGGAGEESSVQLSTGTVLTGRGSDQMDTGQPASATIKPVDIRIVDSPSRNTIVADVVGSTFLGDSVELRLRGGGAAIRIPVDRSARFESGTSVNLYLPPDKVIVVEI